MTARDGTTLDRLNCPFMVISPPATLVPPMSIPTIKSAISSFPPHCFGDEFELRGRPWRAAGC